MRTLDELGISPAPWKIGEDGVVESATYKDNYTDLVHDWPYPDDRYSQCHKANTRLIYAAPELFETLRQLVDYLSLNNWTDRELDPFIEAADNALAKASGESEVKE